MSLPLPPKIEKRLTPAFRRAELLIRDWEWTWTKAGIFGLLFGLPALRLSGVYLALATFGLAVSIPFVAKRFEGFTGGGGGLHTTLLASPTSAFSTNEWISYLTWSIGAVS